MLLGCSHDGIVGYRDFYRDSDMDDNIVICLLMEYCELLYSFWWLLSVLLVVVESWASGRVASPPFLRAKRLTTGAAAAGDGSDVWERIAALQRAQEPLPAPLCVGWVLQVVDALRYLHACERDPAPGYRARKHLHLRGGLGLRHQAGRFRARDGPRQRRRHSVAKEQDARSQKAFCAVSQ